MLKKTILTIIALVLVFGLGMLAGTKLKSKSATPANQENTFQAGWNAAKARLATIGIGALPGEEIKNISGTVQKISGSSITIKAVSSADPLSDPSLDTRTVQTNSDTKFFQYVQKDPAQFQKEMADFEKQIEAQSSDKNAAGQPLVSPVPEDKKEISLSDVKEGQSIGVVSNDNILDKAQFTAAEVDVQ